MMRGVVFDRVEEEGDNEQEKGIIDLESCERVEWCLMVLDKEREVVSF